jgi:hypothetical protein
MDFPGPEGQYPVAPPILLAEVHITFLRPSAELGDHRRFTTAGWSSDDDLAKTGPLGKRYAFDQNQILYRDSLHRFTATPPLYGKRMNLNP